MITRTVQRGLETATAYIPEASDVADLKVGDKALNVWGEFAEVTDVTARSVDIHGAPFVCYYTRDGSGWISAGMKAGELVRTMPLTRLLDSAACDALEREMRAGS